jgi:proton-translocating NADH-quinone oxidoreductase chain M
MNSTSLFYFQDILFYTSLIPLIGILLLIFINPEQQKLLKIVALNFSCLPFLSFLFIWGGFKKSVGTFQFVTKILWIPVLNLNITLGIDGISLFFLLLTTLLIPLCILISWNTINSNLKGYLISFLIIEFLLIGVFCVLDLLMFYIFFESILIPMFLIVGIWGSRERKMLASYYFFLYTLLGSVVMLLSILYIYNQVGTTDYEILLTFVFSDFEQKILWFTFFLAFAAKVPMVPVHLWLPEAHVEAPTAGSVILAGVLLKLGTYGFIRFSLPLFPQASFYFTPFVYTMSLIGIVYTSLTAIRQTDFKRIIDYTSIAHMNVVILATDSLQVLYSL